MVTPDRLGSAPWQPLRPFSYSIPASAGSRYCVRSSGRGPTRIMSMSPTTRSFPTATTARTQIIARVVPLIGELIAAHAPDLVVIACNTASTLVMSHLRAAYSVPFVGTVPAIKPACASSKTKRVSVLGTKGTVKREYTQALIRDFAPGLRGDAGRLGGSRLAGGSGAERRRGERRGDIRRTRALFCRRRRRRQRPHRHRRAGLHPLSRC